VLYSIVRTLLQLTRSFILLVRVMCEATESWCASANLATSLIYTKLDVICFPCFRPSHCFTALSCVSRLHTHITSIVLTDPCMIRQRGMLPCFPLCLLAFFSNNYCYFPFKSGYSLYSSYYIVASCCASFQPYLY
jgi:hypothetical protein